MLYVLLVLAVLGLLTSTGFAAIVLWAVPGYLKERRLALARMREHPGFVPPLTLLKPLHGAEPGLEGYLETFFEQEYPEYEILFCTRSPEDAGLAIARKVAARYPNIPAKFLSTNGQPDYINAKAASMELMESAAAHEIMVISDSDVRVTPDYLRAVALPFADPQVGGMTCPYRGVAASERKRGRAVGAARSGRHVGGNDGRRACGAGDGRDAIRAGTDDGFPARDHPPDRRI